MSSFDRTMPDESRAFSLDRRSLRGTRKREMENKIGENRRVHPPMSVLY